MERCETGTLGMFMRVMRLIKPYATEERLGMRLVEFVTLGHLRDRDGVCSQQALGEDLAFDRNNLVLLLNELEDADYVTRTRDRTDRRRHIVAITASGEKALKKAEVAFEAVADDVLVGLDTADRDQLRALLGQALVGACETHRHHAPDAVVVTP